MRLSFKAIGVIVGLALSACTSTTPVKPLATASTTVAPQTAVVSRSCVQLNRIREARVVDDRTIDFYLSNREVLRNTLPNSCPQLGFERAFSYATSISQLCSVDIITVIVQGGGPQRGASCGLGTFVPYTPPVK